MKILFLHGWQSVSGGVKPTYLAQHGHEVVNPKLPDEDFNEAVRIAQTEFDRHQPQAVVGSSRGGAVAMNINSGQAKLVLLCLAWKKWGTARQGDVDRGRHGPPFGRPEPLAAMLKACDDAMPTLKTGDVVRAIVRKTAVLGLFCRSR